MDVGIKKTGGIEAQHLSQRWGGSFATRAALQALSAKDRCDGMCCLVQSDFSLWTFAPSSALVTTGDPNGELALTPSAGSGRWIRADKAFVMKLAIGFGTADAAALLTVLEGFAFRLASFPWWEVTTAFSGGSSSAIGVSSSITGYTTKGDLLGGAAGDVAAALGAGINTGTLGAELDDNVGFHAMLFEEGNEIRFDRITSVFTAGAGFVRVPVLMTTAPATP